jgi:hypothetical protein
MKNLKIASLLLFCIALLSAKCKKENILVSELSKLPPETHTGANTFGCLVNGQAFLPKGSFLGGAILQCNYIHINDGDYFVVQGNINGNNPGSGTSVQVQTDSLAISENVTIPLLKYFTPGFASGTYGQILFTSSGVKSIDYRTNLTTTGQLHITYLDDVKQIVAGTFSFDAINSNGEKVEVRNGRFDVYFTR